jgi:PIN domain nuclease of toxin-antitoxin system
VTAVLDASAFLALVLGERGGARVAEYVGGAVMSSVNYAEVLTKLGDGGLPDEMTEAIVERLQIQILPFTETHAVQAARLRRPTADRGLSLGDRACLAVASVGGTKAITADRAWRDLEVGVEVVVVR